MELSIQERLKDLRVERGLTLEQLEEQVNLSKSALGSYEAKDFKDSRFLPSDTFALSSVCSVCVSSSMVGNSVCSVSSKPS